MEGYARLQRRLMLVTLVISLCAALFAYLRFDLLVARSLLVGSCAGLLYLRLLARSVARLGGGSRQVGRFQIVVPVLLVVAAAKLPQLESASCLSWISALQARLDSSDRHSTADLEQLRFCTWLLTAPQSAVRRTGGRSPSVLADR